MSEHVVPAREARDLSAVLRLVGSGVATSRADLAAETGLSASTITQRVNRLVDAGLLTESGQGESRGGRRPSLLQVNAAGGCLLTASIGATTCRFAVTDLAATVLASAAVDIDVEEGPEKVLGLLSRGFTELLEQVSPERPPMGVAIGVPGPVDTGAGRVIRPPMMVGWDGYRIADAIAVDFPGVPVLVNNDANVMALGEYWARHQEPEHLIFVKVGTGIGCGIVSNGRLHVGANGVAGDIGHIRVPDHDDVQCVCGRTGCVTAVASGKAIAAELREKGLPARTSRDVVRLVLDGNVVARHTVRAAAQEIGRVVAAMVSLYNPSDIVIGGLVGYLADDMLTEIRSSVYFYAQPLASHSLKIEPSLLLDQAGTVGGAVLLLQHLLSPEGITALL
jgi:predicted NBD/HSP70 family sugar kinase